MQQLKKYGAAAAAATAVTALLSLSACGGSSSSEAPPGPGPDKSALWKNTLDNVARVLWLPAYDPQKIPADIQQNLKHEKNSPEAVGKATKLLIDDILKNPDSCSANNAERLNLLKSYSDKLNPQQAYALRNLLGKDTSRGYKQLPSEMGFKFPADDAPDGQYQVGWHFFVGSAYSESGEEFGVQMMFWQYTMLPPALAKTAGMSEAENQVIEMHLAVSRAGDRHYRAQPYVVSGATGLTSFKSAPFNYQQGKNQMRSRQADQFFPIDLTAWGLDEGKAKPVDMKINIGLTQSEGKGYVLNGQDGLTPSCGGVGTLYYSVTNLRIDPKVSWLQLGEEKIKLSSGKFWYDHQYGTGMMPSGNPRTEALRAVTNVTAALKGEVPDGWDWLMFQFDDNTEMSLASLHTLKNKSFYEQTGTNPPGTMQAGASGNFVRADGSYKTVKATIEVPKWIKSKISYGPYLPSNTWYPDRVKVMVEDDELHQREVYMVPIVSNGQQGYFAHGSQYSEGAVYLEDKDGKRIGRGFLESTGYVDGVPQILDMLGIAATADTLKLMKPSVLDAAQIAQCTAYLAQPEIAAQLAQEFAQCKGMTGLTSP